MKRKIRILHLEDSPEDAEFVEYELKKLNVECEILVVDDEQTFITGLHDFIPDVILSDHSLPTFNSIEALALARNFNSNIPFILITGAISEEFAVKVMKLGAYDYILKDRLQRLPAAIHNAIEKSKFESERQKFLSEVIASEARFREFFELAPEAILVIDADNKIFVDCNANALNLLKFSSSEILHMSPSAISPVYQPDGRNSEEKITKLIAMTLVGEKPVFEWMIRDAEGNDIICEARLVMLGNSDQTLIRASLVDITLRKNEEMMREKMTSDLALQNKNLEQFAYIVSHNLRSPVANILGLSDILQEEAISESDRGSMMGDLKTSVKMLDDVIKDLNLILQVKREISEKKEVVNFSIIIQRIKSSIANIVGSENVNIICDFSQVDEMLTLKSYLYSIFLNLITNSIKYRHESLSPVIYITSYRLKDKIQIVYRDNGLGIDLAKRGEQVFGLYKRFHPGTAEGKGMGLFMVKTQVEALGGTIGIASEVNKGTQFTLEFNLPVLQH